MHFPSVPCVLHVLLISYLMSTLLGEPMLWPRIEPGSFQMEGGDLAALGNFSAERYTVNRLLRGKW